MKDFEEVVRIAHIRKKDGFFEIQTVEEHSVGTSILSELFASVFGAGGWGKQNGLWHDLGKCTQNKFQSYIRSVSGMTTEAKGANKPDHATAGAILAKVKLLDCHGPLSYCIAGHHTGLLDWISADESNMTRRLNKESCYQEMLKDTSPEMLELTASLENPEINDVGKELHLWMRMLFSCLVDADWLDTEQFMLPEQAKLRGCYDTLNELKDRFDKYMRELSAEAPPSFINEKRADILLHCLEMANELPGLFSLTVPTGGGKTLASIAWALYHAIRYKKDRIIVVIPYTSIIVQTAAILRKIFGEENVVEHHSNLQLEDCKEQSSFLLATENWDAPIIVTTNVQFFESLFACKKSKCRKLHNICNSVIIMDEAQMLPVEFLQPILDALQGLQATFKASILFTTATLPVFSGRIGSGEHAFNGLKSNVKEITSPDDNLFEAFKRVELHWPDSTTTFDELVDDLLRYEQVLCVVNTRKEAREIYRRMPKDTLHLSRMMCSDHIMEVICLIKQKLANNEPIRVVSTQLIEAGVNIDFPVVYRAFAGLDSIIQAAGRCNREGKLNEKGLLGKVVVFTLEQSVLHGLMKKGADTLKVLLKYSDRNNPFDPAFMARYFVWFYDSCNTFDLKNIKEDLYDKDFYDMHFSFATAAEKFRLIDDKNAVSILINYGKGATLIQELKEKGPNFGLIRKLQRYCVSIKKWDFEQLAKTGSVVEYSSICILENNKNYDARAGLILDDVWAEEVLIA